MSNPALNDWNQSVIAEFRANGGQVGGRYAGAPLLLLTTTGAKTGRQFTTPLVYGTDGDRLLIFASKNGAPTHPDWYHNLVANPEVTVERGTETFQAHAVVTTGEERDRRYAELTAQAPQFSAHQAKTTRQIPIVALERIS